MGRENIEERQQEQQRESENLDLTAGNECEEVQTTVEDLHMECTQSKELLESIIIVVIIIIIF